jgi:hypothetical protein
MLAPSATPRVGVERRADARQRSSRSPRARGPRTPRRRARRLRRDHPRPTRPSPMCAHASMRALGLLESSVRELSCKTAF